MRCPTARKPIAAWTTGCGICHRRVYAPCVGPVTGYMYFRSIGPFFTALLRVQLCRKGVFSEEFADNLLEVCGHKPEMTRLPKDHFRQSCFSHVFKELGSDA